MANQNANEQTQSIRPVFAKGTDVGRKRGHNEDYVGAFRPSDREKRRQKGDLFIVADGMGGHQAGEVASENAVESISAEYYASPPGDVPGSLSDAIRKANSLIYRQAQASPSRAGMGTTVVAAVIRGQELYLANVGDSRAYLLRNGNLAQVTRDHSFVQEQIEAGILTPEEARNHPQRNVVTRALGSKPEVKVDTFSGGLEPGDILLLCTDGLSEHVDDQDITAILRQYPPKEAVPRLIALANRRGGSDNITALVVQAASVAASTAGAAAVPPPRAAAAASSRPAAARPGLSVPLIAGLSAGGLVVLALLVVGGLFLFQPEWLPWYQTPTPTATATPEPTSTAAATPTASPQATVTPRPTTGGAAVGEPTAVGKVGIVLLGPEDGAGMSPAVRVPFSWKVEVPEMLPNTFTFLVKTEQQGERALCSGEAMSCNPQLPRGEYDWWVELQSEGTLIEKSEVRTLYVREPTSTPTLTPTFTPPPPTDTPPPRPTDTPPSSGGGDGGDTPEPTEQPTEEPTAVPTKFVPSPPPVGGS